jgi:three-Cys-motif partner protein
MRKYLGGWFPIMSRYHGRILFLDGFAGPGAYASGEPGSPLIALDTLLEHTRFHTFANTEFLFVFFEAAQDRAVALQERVDEVVAARGGLPPSVRVVIETGTFVELGDAMVTLLEEQKKSLAPTFAFIDPFGFSGVPLELIARLMSYDRCEVFFNFMVDFINRFATAGNVDHHLTEIYGCDDYLLADEFDTDSRREFLLELYERQMREVVGFPHVFRFDMFNRQGHNIYSMFYGTRSLAGVRLMKDAMWSVDPLTGSRFDDRLADQELLDLDPDFSPLREAICAEFAGREVGVDEVEAFTLAKTRYSASHYKRKVLAELEREGRLEVTTQRAKRNTYPDGTRIRFL